MQLDADLATADKRIDTLFEKVMLPSAKSVTDPLMRSIITTTTNTVATNQSTVAGYMPVSTNDTNH
jgi:hypothetical protein